MGVTRKDIELSEEVRKYPALYDKKSPDFYRKDVVSKCWERIRLVTGHESAALARRDFELLRKRFNGARQKKVGGHSVTLRHEILNQIGDVEGYEFLTWLSPYITLRTTKSEVCGVKNKSDYNNNGNESLMYTSSAGASSTDGDIDYQNAYVSNNSTMKCEVVSSNVNCAPGADNHTLGEDDVIDEPGFSGHLSIETSGTPPQEFRGGSEYDIRGNTTARRWQKRRRESEDETDYVMPRERERWQERSSRPKHNEQRPSDNDPHPVGGGGGDPQGHFASYIASSLRQLPTHLQFSCQHEISNVLFKFQSESIVDHIADSKKIHLYKEHNP